jgi:adenylate cyclase
MGVVKKILLSPWTAILTLALVLGIRIMDPSFVESIRLRYFDQLIANKAPTVNNIYTVNIDEATLDKYGQWPLPRNQYGDLIEEIYAHNAGLVVWNILMPEPDRNGQDSDLAYTLNTNPVILSSVPATRSKNPPRQVGVSIMRPEFVDRIVQYPGMISNIEALNSQAAGVGIANVFPEIDGVNRRLPLVVSVDDILYPSVALETLRVAAGDPSFQIKLNELGVEKMRIPQFGPITTDPLGRIWVDWSQKSKSASAVNMPADFGGAIVIVGTSAAGLGNPVPTSIGSVWPQDMHAAVIGTMINGVNIERPDWADGAEILAIALAGIILLLLTRWVYVGLASILVLVAGGAYGSYYLFGNYLYLFDITAFVSGVILVALHAYGVKFVSEFLQKQQIKKQFGTYLSPDLVAQLQRQPELLQLGGDEQELSIMFTDVRGFTTISEHYGKDVQGLTKIMNRYMTAMTKKILENHGTLDKYIGDAQMAFWNAPVNNPQHAKDAVRTALEMMVSLDAFNREITAEGIPAFGMGLGINTDTVVVGNMGSDQRFDYTCLGDGVNLASRLEGQSKSYGVRIILGPKTAEYVRDEFPVVHLDNIAVKGKKEGVNIYTLGKTVGWQHDEYLKHYFAGNWVQAMRIAHKLMKEPEVDIKHYYELMIERMQEGLPANWDGTYHATSK